MFRKTWFRLMFTSIVVLAFGEIALSSSSAQGLSIDQGEPEGVVSTITSAFTYQGNLTESGNPASGSYDFEFRLFDAASDGNQSGSTVQKDDVLVSNGLFTIEIDFGSVFNGTALWLEISVRPGNSSGSYTTLTPRQTLTAAPYALFSQSTAWSGLSGVPAGFADNIDNNTTYTAGTGMTLNSNQFSLTASYRLPQGCSNSQVAEWNGSAWVCIANSSHNHWGQTWSGSGAGLTLSGGNAGIFASGSSYGVYGSSSSTSGRGLYGYTSATSGYTDAVFGHNESTDGRGITGWASAITGMAYGVYGISDSTDGAGVYGYATASSGYTSGVFGQSDSNTYSAGVTGVARSNDGITYGVWGESASTEGQGVAGRATASSGETYGVYGRTDSSSLNSSGVYGYASATSGSTNGVWGQSDSTVGGIGVYGFAQAYSGNGIGVYGETNSPTGYAGYFTGDVIVYGDFSVSGTKAFVIDHPLDPQNQYLYHYNIESSEVLNQYSGNATLDENGAAWVQLPDWFEAINTDFRYQLTPIGAAMPNLHIAQEIQGNIFQIAGGEPGMKVSWLVTALRDDLYMQQNPHPAEIKKTGDESGTYLAPELYGQPDELGLDYLRGQNFAESE